MKPSTKLRRGVIVNRIHWLAVSIVGAICVAAVLGFVTRHVESGRSEDAELLSQLLAENQLMGLPEEFPGPTNALAVDFHAASGVVKRTVAHVQYSVGERGDRGVSFVFDENGECLLWRPDDTHRSDGGVLDLTGDGCDEKVFEYLASEHGEGSGPGMKVLDVYAIGVPEIRKLLEIHYNLDPGAQFENSLSLLIAPYGTIGAPVVGLRRWSDGRLVMEAKWDSEHNTFKTVGAASTNWRAIVPAENSAGGRERGQE